MARQSFGPQEHSRASFTLADLVMAIVVVGCVLVPLLPALESDREASQQNQCMNNMKQLGLALLNHHDVYKKFPAVSNQGIATGVASVWWPLPGSAADTGAAPSVGYTTDAGTTKATAGYSWMVRILPFMDEAPLYNTISQASQKFTVDAFTPYNVKANGAGQAFSVTFTTGDNTISKHFAAIQLDECVCPSFAGTISVAASDYKGTPGGDPPAAYGYPGGSDKLGSRPEVATISNYVALSATHFPLMKYATVEKLAATTTIPPTAEAPNGMIVPGAGLNMRACTDGSSKTLMICETIETAMNCWYDGTTAWTTAINPNSIADHAPSEDNPAPSGAANPQYFWMVPAGGSTALNVGPNPKTTVAYSPALPGYCAAPQTIAWGPSSNHLGGIVVHGAADGSAHAIAPDIDPSLYMHLITRAGGEPVAFPDTQ